MNIDLADCVAIVGMSGRFPGARDVNEFWQNLRDGVESIRSFSDEELLGAGVDPSLLADPLFVKSKPILDNIELFDAEFFDCTPAEGEIMGVRHRELVVEGVQFHPESILTPDGPRLLGHFLEFAAARRAERHGHE